MPPSGKKKIVANDVMGFILASICKLSGSHGGRVWKAFLSGWRLMVRVPVVTAGLSTWNVHVLPVCQLLRYSKSGPLHSGHCRHHLWFTWYIRPRPSFRSECFTICPWFYFKVSRFQVLSWKNPHWFSDYGLHTTDGTWNLQHWKKYFLLSFSIKCDKLTTITYSTGIWSLI